MSILNKGSHMTFKERCDIAAACLPKDNYRASLERLHAEMLAAIAAVREPLSAENVRQIHEHLCNTVGSDYKTMSRAVEAAHGIAATKGKP